MLAGGSHVGAKVAAHGEGRLVGAVPLGVLGQLDAVGGIHGGVEVDVSLTCDLHRRTGNNRLSVGKAEAREREAQRPKRDCDRFKWTEKCAQACDARRNVWCQHCIGVIAACTQISGKGSQPHLGTAGLGCLGAQFRDVVGRVVLAGVDVVDGEGPLVHRGTGHGRQRREGLLGEHLGLQEGRGGSLRGQRG